MVKLKVISANDQYAKIRFKSSSSTSRMKMEKLKADYNAGIVDFVNPEVIMPFIDE